MTLRIIAGRCRGRRLKTPAGSGVRPTADRIRETLFNWLMPVLPGARVLDLFAGSGALGLEALSRGAGEAVLVEKDPRHAAVVAENIAVCGLQPAVLRRLDALVFLQQAAQAFDIVFLDPPFGQGLVPRAASLLENKGWLKREAFVYVEIEADMAGRLPQLLPPGWAVMRAKCSGGVSYNLCRRTMPGERDGGQGEG